MSEILIIAITVIMLFWYKDVIRLGKKFVDYVVVKYREATEPRLTSSAEARIVSNMMRRMRSEHHDMIADILKVEVEKQVKQYMKAYQDELYKKTVLTKITAENSEETKTPKRKSVRRKKDVQD